MTILELVSSSQQGGGTGLESGCRVGSEVVGLLVVSLFGNGAMLMFGSEVHLFLGVFGSGRLEMCPPWVGAILAMRPGSEFGWKCVHR